MKINRIQCDKCGNMISSGWKEDQNVVRYNYVGEHGEDCNAEFDLCEKCIIKFRKMLDKFLNEGKKNETT